MSTYDADRSTRKFNAVYGYKLPTSRARNQAPTDRGTDGNSISGNEERILQVVGGQGEGVKAG